MKPYDTWFDGDRCYVALPPLHWSESDYVFFSGTAQEVDDKIADWKELWEDFNEAI